VVVGYTTLNPGESSYLMLEPIMHEGMGGAHHFEVTVETDSPTVPVIKLHYRAVFGPQSEGIRGDQPTAPQ
jgi:hypothetical protein